MITALDGSILTVNRAFTRITGYTEEEVLGQNPRILKSGRQSPEFYKAMWETIRQDGFWHGEAWNRRKDGSHFAEDITITMVPGQDGRPSNYIAVLSDITKSSEKRKWLEQRSYFDALTGLPNRTLFTERIESALARATSSGVAAAVAFIDLDGFKEVNDSLGHAAGDDVLIELAARLTKALRKTDTLARFGGDEFVAIMPDLIDDSIVPVLMNRLLEAFRLPIQIDNSPVVISASIGYALFPADAGSAEQLLKMADEAMYAAKHAGRNRYCAYQRDSSEYS